MKLAEFNLVNRSKLIDAIVLNDQFEIEPFANKESGLKYFVIRNVLKNPDQFVELLKSHNAYGGDVEVSTPGYRQLISPLELPTLANLYTQFYNQFVKETIPISSWCFASNIYHDKMVCWNRNNRPHYDPQPLTTYLWLTKNLNAGTSFYRLNINGKLHYRYNKEIQSLDSNEYKKYFKYDMNTATTEEWVKFESDEYWEVYDITPSEYNSVVFYDPLFFHNAYYDKNDAEVRYSLLSFLDRPVKQHPFWVI